MFKKDRTCLKGTLYLTPCIVLWCRCDLLFHMHSQAAAEPLERGIIVEKVCNLHACGSLMPGQPPAFTNLI
jgi:hypothetical protein